MNRAADHHLVMAELENMKTLGHAKPVRRKTTERKKLIKQLDQVVREIVMKRPHYCVTCGSTERLQNGHLITRSRYGTRWDLMNCNIQCSGCNFRHEFQPEIYTRWFLRYFGVNEYQELCQRAETQGKYTIDELETMLIELTEKNKTHR